MLLVEELRELPIFQNFQLIAGEGGLTREVVSATTLEYENVVDGFLAFHRGDFILTSLFFAREDANLVLHSFKALAERGVAAIAVKTSFYRELPEEAVRFADEKDLPLFLFGEDIFTEKIILAVGEVLEKRKSILYDEQILRDFLAGHSVEEISKYARKFLNISYNQYFIACLSPRYNSANAGTMLVRIICRTRDVVQDAQVRWVRYQNRLLMIYSFSGGSEADLRRVLARQMERLSENMAKYHCGLSESHSKSSDFDIALEQAFAAESVAELQQKDCLSYSDIGIYQYLLPLLKNRTAVAQYRRAIRTLQEYDGQYHSELLRTLRCYVKNQGKLSATAEEMYQHVNTIRYRLGRVRELVPTEPFYEQIYLIVQLYELENCENSRQNAKEEHIHE